MTTAVVIVNYFKAKRVIESVQKLQQQVVSTKLHIVVVDNSASADEADVLSALREHGVDVIIADENLGYARGINLGARAVPDADDILLVNPDILIDEEGVVGRMLDILALQPDIGVLACTQLNDDGSPVEIARNFPSFLRLFLRRIYPGGLSEIHLLEPLRQQKTQIDVDWVQSSFTLVRGRLWREIGGLNEDYYVFMSDVELCLESWRRRLRVVVTSAAKVRADGLRASRGGITAVWKSKTLRIHIKDAIKYHVHNGFFHTPYTRII